MLNVKTSLSIDLISTTVWRFDKKIIDWTNFFLLHSTFYCRSTNAVNERPYLLLLGTYISAVGNFTPALSPYSLTFVPLEEPIGFNCPIAGFDPIQYLIGEAGPAVGKSVFTSADRKSYVYL